MAGPRTRGPARLGGSSLAGIDPLDPLAPSAGEHPGAPGRGALRPAPGHIRRVRPRWGWAGLLAVAALAVAALALTHPARRSPAPLAHPRGPAAAAPAASGGAPAGIGATHTRAGALVAAENDLVAYSSSAVFSPRARAALLKSILVPSRIPAVAARWARDAPALTARFNLSPSGAPPAGEVFVDRTVPFGAHLVSYTPTTARVSVWAVGMVGLAGASSRVPVTAGWVTSTITLDWTPLGWRWAGATQVSGPTPIAAPLAPSGAASIAAAYLASLEPRYGP